MRMMKCFSVLMIVLSILGCGPSKERRTICRLDISNEEKFVGWEIEVISHNEVISTIVEKGEYNLNDFTVVDNEDIERLVELIAGSWAEIFEDTKGVTVTYYVSDDLMLTIETRIEVTDVSETDFRFILEYEGNFSLPLKVNDFIAYMTKAIGFECE